MGEWNPEQYLRFRDERTRPAADLAARISLQNPRTILDAGCGPGNSTKILRDRWPGADLTGLDSSPAMIEKARAEFPSGNWVIGDLAEINSAYRYDLVFSNAVLQWLPDHRRLVPKLFSAVRDGGTLAVQVPANHESPLHQALLSVSSGKAWSRYTSGCGGLLTYHKSEFYYEILSPLAGAIDLWETTYFHILESHLGLIEWYKSTGMRPYLDALPDDASRKKFEREVLDACRDTYPLRADGKIVYPFKRTFFIAYA